MVDHIKIRRESMRWNLISTLDKARPHTSNEQFCWRSCALSTPIRRRSKSGVSSTTSLIVASSI